MTLADRIVDRLIGSVTCSLVRSVLAGAALLYLGWLALGWWTVALVVLGAAWEFARYPGRLPSWRLW